MVQCVALDMMEQFELASIKGQTDGYPFACLGADVLFCVVFFFLIAVTQYTTMGDVRQGSAAFPVFFLPEKVCSWALETPWFALVQSLSLGEKTRYENSDY